MSFGLKNIGTTYQRAIETYSVIWLHKEIEIYMDDIIVKSREKEDHC
jgi:hypothetical protein